MKLFQIVQRYFTQICKNFLVLDFINGVFLAKATKQKIKP